MVLSKRKYQRKMSLLRNENLIGKKVEGEKCKVEFVENDLWTILSFQYRGSKVNTSNPV